MVLQYQSILRCRIWPSKLYMLRMGSILGDICRSRSGTHSTFTNWEWR
nr:MAG TPA_asm: hypothetical protein [Caudoviricetes sp.]